MARGRRNVDDLLLAALGCGATAEAAAHKAGVSRTTVQRRLQDPAFRQRLRAQGTETLKRASYALTAAMVEGIKTLLGLQASSVPHAVRLGAARSILEFSIRLREVTDTEERLAALEEQMASQQAR
jgi:ribosomal protein S9